ncbi:peptidoglycan bridge formation glycyltransferase FemA/FemB family protein [Pseudarthrobacter sp. J64]|uniref:lipid II:glycine glycyltransferase FemX n=1 Tax=Pseudarthrobacter sp. J64 TaxID=3116485 RepID=UPI002E809C1B|nr:peptidoglycan bridge formation glycyltransferase FemA/FemB family protein [Pseudarthrobacter sp. J64]MEE2570904.1 peptidoglycan bridge formation glycyltransferase FemA/FemB family protein [Pseudarthrobacter sp. J64]
MSLAVMPCTDRALWDETVDRFEGHPQQLWGWGQTKAMHGWSVERLLLNDAGETVGAAQLLVRRLPFPFRSLAYVARGPMCAAGNTAAVLESLAGHASSRYGAVALSIEPDWDADSEYADAVAAAGFAASANTILIPRTLILDLTRTDDELMADMSKSTRANVRKAMRSEVVQFRKVATDAELEQVLAVYHETAERAGFGIHEDQYYRDIYRNMGDGSPIIGAFDGDQLLAFVWLSRSGTTAFELYGGVSSEGQKQRVNYGVKWAAFQAMREDGCKRYDFNGLLNDGISDFKKQFAKHENMLMGTWEKPLSPLYPAYSKAMPAARRSLQVARRLVRTAGSQVQPAVSKLLGLAKGAVKRG